MKALTRLYIIIFFVFIAVFFTLKAEAQKYTRNALSVYVLNKGGQYDNDIVRASKNIQVPDKFDNNLLKNRVLSVPNNQAYILSELQKEKVASQIVSKWFMRDSITGMFNMELVHNRGLYDATSDEMAKASAKKIGIATLMDAGESLVNKSYIFVLAFEIF